MAPATIIRLVMCTLLVPTSAKGLSIVHTDVIMHFAEPSMPGCRLAAQTS